MIQARPAEDNTPDEFLHPAERRERLRLHLTDDEIAREARSRRRQLQILRKMIAEREGRHDG